MLSIAVINRAARGDRWATLTRRFTAAGLGDIERFLAVEPAVCARAPTTVSDHREPSPAGIACALSHLQVWERALARPAQPAIVVCEDDAMPTPELARLPPAVRERVLAAAPADADLILLGCTPLLRARARRFSPLRLTRKLAMPGRSEFRRVYYFNGTWAYLVNRRGIEQLLPRLRPVRHFDHQISELLAASPEVFRAYELLPAWFHHDYQSPSDVDCPAEPAADAALLAALRAAQSALHRRHGIRTEIPPECV